MPSQKSSPMFGTRHRRPILGLALLSATAMTAQGRQADPADKPMETMVILERVGAADFLVSEKDAGLKRALAMLPDRLNEFLEMLPPEEQPPRALIEFVVRAISHPARLAVTNKGFDQQTGMPGIGAVLSFKTSDEADARKMESGLELIRMLALSQFEPSDSKRFKGMKDLALPFGVMSYGPRKAADGWRFEAIFAAVDDPDAPFAAVRKPPEGMKPAIRGSIDLAALSPFISMFAGFAAMGAPPGQDIMKQFREAGIIGPEAIALEFDVGYTGTHAFASERIVRAGKYAENWGTSSDPLEPGHFAVVPPDATFADVRRSNIKSTWANLQSQFLAAGGAGTTEDLRRIEAELGISISDDLIEPLGSVSVIYFSDSTGGGSIFSGVLLHELADPAKFTSTLSTLAGKANAIFDRSVPPPAMVELAQVKRGAGTFLQLRFPGLPVPIEPTFGVVGKWLVVGATPQAAFVASTLIEGAKAGGGLMENPVFKSELWELPGNARPLAVTFINSPRTMRDGYAAVSLIGSMFANLARTKSAAAEPREPGLVLPLLSDLAKDAHPILIQTYWQGEDLLMDTRADRSFLVNLTAILGIGDAAPLIGGMAIGAGIGMKAAEGPGAPPMPTVVTEDDHDPTMDDGMPDHDEHQADQAEPAKPRSTTPY